MPWSARRPCRCEGCSRLAEKGKVYCKQHAHMESDRMRGTAAQRGYDARWRDARLYFLRRNPLCVVCLKEGRAEAATVVDHIVPHRGDWRLFWDENNWQPLCKRHHDEKTARGE